jgi:hypothetical protein
MRTGTGGLPVAPQDDCGKHATAEAPRAAAFLMPIALPPRPHPLSLF